MRITLREQALLIQRLASLLGAGIPLLEALRMMQRQARRRDLAKVLESVTADVENGQPLATSLGQFRGVFGELVVSVIAIGERSGTLDVCLARLALELRKKQAFRRKMIGAAVYPAFIVVTTLGIALLLVAYVFPKILPMFQSLDFELPWTTRALMGLSGFLIRRWPWLAFGLAAVGAAVAWALRQPKGRAWADRATLAVPVLGGLVRRSAVSSACRVVGLLLRSGVPINEAHRIAARAIGHSGYRQALLDMAAKLDLGEPLHAQVERRPKLFPPEVAELVAVGERTGNLCESLENLARLYEEEFDDLTRDLTTVFEPVLLAGMGVVVGFVAISIITPIYAITQHLNA
jgi:type IV pilus assembly protein PilC